MHWDRLFEDLEGQLASEWEIERAALAAESERLRISRLAMRDRLRPLCSAGALAIVDIRGAGRIRARLRTLGADWIATTSDERGILASGIRIVPLQAIDGLHVDHGVLLSSLEALDADSATELRDRMTFGFILRDLARRRQPVRIRRSQGDELHGTIDRAGADHLDLAVHDAGAPRLASAVRGFCMIPFNAVACVLTATDQIP